MNAALSGMSRYTLPEPVRDDYLASYQGDRFAQSVRYLRSYPAELPVLAGLLPRIHTPVQIIAGAGDTAVPPVNARFLHERLPDSKLDVIDAGHFTWEDAAGRPAGSPRHSGPSAGRLVLAREKRHALAGENRQPSGRYRVYTESGALAPRAAGLSHRREENGIP